LVERAASYLRIEVTGADNAAQPINALTWTVDETVNKVVDETGDENVPSLLVCDEFGQRTVLTSPTLKGSRGVHL
jgi:hypothetical protein